MKTLLLLGFILYAFLGLAQTPPQGINYQAVAHDASGSPLAAQNIDVRIGILSTSSTGTLEWEEVHSVTTNDYGLFDLVIGTGTSTGSGGQTAFANISWATAPHFLKVEVDPGSGYETMGTMQFMSVPYALHASTVTNDAVDDADADASNELITGGTLNGTDLEITDAGGTTTIDLSSLSGGGSSPWTVNGNDISNNNTGNIGIGTNTPTLGKIQIETVAGNEIFFSSGGSNAEVISNVQMMLGTNNGSVLDLQTNGLSRMRIDGAGNIGIGNATPDATLDLVGTFQYDDGNQQAGYVLTSDANGNATWQNVSGDGWGTDVVNSDATLSGDGTAGTPLTVVGDLTDDQDITYVPGTQSLSIDNGSTVTLDVDDADADATNELITGGSLSGTNLEIFDAGGTTTIDVSALATSDTLPIIKNANFSYVSAISNTQIEMGFTGNPYFILNDENRMTLSQNSNFFIGASPGGTAISSGIENFGFGTGALASATTASWNVGVGTNALQALQTGEENIAMSRDALRNVTNGFDNVAIGSRTLELLTNGNTNIAIGRNAGFYITSGSQNVLIGYNAGSTGVNAAQTGNIKIGAGAGANDTGNNKLYIDNQGVTAPLIYGNLASDSLKIFGSLSVGEEYTFPLTDGNSGEVMSTDGNGQLSWGAAGDSDWNTGTGIIYNTTDNVGIGAIIPNAHLEVYGSETVTSIFGYNSSPATTINIHNDDQTVGNYTSLSFSTAASNSSVYNSARIMSINGNHTAGSLDGSLIFMTREPANITEAMRITGNNQIGIGTTNPSARLDVVGTFQLEDGTQGAGRVLISDANGNAAWKPNQVAFHVGSGGNNNNGNLQSLGVSVTETLDFDASAVLPHHLNPGTVYNTTTDHFVAPTSGVYFLSASVSLAGAGSNYITLNMMHSAGTSIDSQEGFFNTIHSNRITRTLTSTVHLNAGDEVWIEYYNTTGGASFYRENSTFSGHLVYAD